MFLNNWLHDIGNFFGRIFTPATIAKAKTLADEAETLLPEALKAMEVIQGIVGANPVLTTVEALISKYLLHVTPEVLNDPIQLRGLIQTAAVKELAKAAPNASIAALTLAVTTASGVIASQINAVAAVPAPAAN